MCGIAGIVVRGEGTASLDALSRMSQQMVYRGPDGDGMWVSDDARVGFVHRRLSIIDVSSRSDQPMQTVNGRFVVTFNGEIYNYRDLRSDLASRGYSFVTSSDTEVLLHLYAEYGADMVARLRGMFAFAIYDKLERRVFMARDPYGIKPLYYSDDGKRLLFASQVKALLASGLVASDISPAGVVGFHLFGAVPEPFTWRRAVQALPAGNVMTVDFRRAPRMGSYCSVGSILASAEMSNAGTDPFEVAAQVRTSLADSVAHHLVADVPVGLFLSAGIDSGALLGLMREQTSEGIKTITLCFEEFEGGHDDETPLAAAVAQQFGASHERRLVTHAEFVEDLPKILAAMDQPSIDGVNTWFVSKAARELGLKVAVSGLGGDELFGGYPAFQDVPRAVRLMRLLAIPGAETTLIAPLVSMAQRLFRSSLDAKVASLLKLGSTYEGAYLVRRGVFMPDEIHELTDPDVVQVGLEELQPLAMLRGYLKDGPTSSFGKVATLEAEFYMRNQLLRDTDWASMAHSLEVRLPFVDSHLLENVGPYLASGLNAAEGKALLAKAPLQALPNAVTHRRKTGFSTPIAQWLEEDSRTQAWRSISKLAKPDCRWSRRWVYSVCHEALEA